MNPSRRAHLLLGAGLLPCAQAVIEPASAVRGHDLARAVANAIARDPILAGGSRAAAWGECDGSRIPASLHARVRERCCRDERRAVSRPMASPVRARRLRWSADRDELIVTVSARVGDASTLNLLCDDILGPSNDDAREAPSYAAVVEWERTWAKDGDDESRLFWRLQGRRIRDGAWPYQQRPGVPPFDSGFVSVELTAAERDRVTRAARERGAAFPALLLACWQIVWRRLTNSAPVVGVVLPARRDPELAQVPGPLDRTVPHAVALRGPGTIADAVRVVDQWWRSAAEWLEHCEFATTRPGPGHVFHLGYVHTTWRGAAARLIAPLIDTVGARFSLVTCDVEGQPFFAIQFHRQAIGAAETQRIASAFAACLCDAIDRPTASLDDLRLMRESARVELLTSRNETAVRRYIVDRGGELVPFGVTGELMLGGVPAGRGYWNRPAATAASFVPDRFSGVPGARLHHTGDRARYRADGVVEYVDAERQVTPAPPESTRPAADAGRLPPPTQAEEIITGVWAAVLGRPHVAASDHFFDVGGHSLNAVQVLVRLREIFGRDIELHTLFDHPTPAALARALMAAQAGRPEDAALEPASLEPVGRDGPLPLSFAQERIWIVDQLTGSRSYHVPLTISVTGSLDARALAAALRSLANRHEALRTTFDVVDDRPVQRIAAAGPAPVVWADLSDASAKVLARLRSRTQRQLERAAFDLRRGPLWRVAVLRCAADRHLVCGTLHHIVTDGWSIGILFRDIAALYEAAQKTAWTEVAETSEPSRLPALPIQYADYAAWQRRTLSGERLAAELAYWRDQLADVPMLALPTDRPRPAIASGRGAVATHRWPAALAARTRQFGRERGATAFMVILAAWQAVLARYAGQRDVAVGVPIAQRPRPELEGLIGIFLNTVVVRTVMPARASWASLVARVRTNALAAYAHQLVPFEQVIADLQPQRDLARGPLFQVMFVLQNYPAPSLQVADLRFEAADSGGTTTKFDLELTMHLHGDEVIGQLQYATDLFDRPTADRMLGHIETLIDAALASPDSPVDDLPLLTAAEQTQIVHEWNAPGIEIAAPLRIEHRIAAAALASSDRLAIVGGETAYRYGELHARSTRLARHLRRLGVARDRLVAVLSDRGAAAVVGFLGVLKAGAGYAPLSPDDPVDRLRSQVHDLGSRVIVCGERCAPLVSGLGFEIVTLDEGAAWEGESDVPILADGGGDDAAYAMYTSGSTGQPKAVVVRHGGLVNYTDWVIARLSVPAHAAWQYAVVSSLQADLGNTTLYAGLATGGTVHVLSHHDATDPTRIAHVMTAAGIDVLKIVPTHLQALIEASDEPLPLPRRWLVLGGERLTWDLAAMLRDRGVRVLNHYGPTETTVGCVAAEIETSATVAAAPLPRSSDRPVAFGARASVPIGRPIANTRAYVRDQSGGLVPAGIPGELFIGGAGVARGYWRQPALTAERFVPDPYGPPGGRLYRTGDLVRADASGVLEFVGRRDHQVKVRGHRVELGEIEHALRRLPGVRHAAVVMREDTPGDRRIAAYVVPAEADAAVPGDVWQRRLAAHLPAHMVPPVIVPLPALPITANGKLDRRRLPQPGGERPRLDSAYIAPRTETESAVARLWAEGLRLDQVGIHDNFFALGGDSIAAIQFAHRAQREGLPATPLLVFQHQTVAELAANLAAHEGVGQAEAEPELGPEASMTAAQLAYLSSRVEIEL